MQSTKAMSQLLGPDSLCKDSNLHTHMHASTSENYLQTVPTLPTQGNNSLFRKRAHELEKNIQTPALACTYLTFRKSIPLFLRLCLQNRACTALSLQILVNGIEGVHLNGLLSIGVTIGGTAVDRIILETLLKEAACNYQWIYWPQCGRRNIRNSI